MLKGKINGLLKKSKKEETTKGVSKEIKKVEIKKQESKKQNKTLTQIKQQLEEIGITDIKTATAISKEVIKQSFSKEATGIVVNSSVNLKNETNEGCKKFINNVVHGEYSGDFVNVHLWELFDNKSPEQYLIQTISNQGLVNIYKQLNNDKACKYINAYLDDLTDRINVSCGKDAIKDRLSLKVGVIQVMDKIYHNYEE
ncbi:hypothetical protein UT300012_22290 [Paraclostridium bifermentans]